MSQILELVRQDNIWVLEGMINAGVAVPDNLFDWGVRYDPPARDRPVYDAWGNVIGMRNEVDTPQQEFLGISDILERGYFSCGDGAAAEAAMTTVKRGIDTKCDCVAQGGYEYHAIYYTPKGPVDPSENWLRRVAELNGRIHRPSSDNAQRMRMLQQHTGRPWGGR